MNYSTMAFLADDNVIAVKCIFEEERDMLRQGRGSVKEYTYKTTDKNLKKDDLVVVQCEGPSNYFGFCVVKVTEVDVEIDLNSSFNYKWIVGKVDTQELDDTIKAERALIKQIKQLELKSKKQKFKEALGLEGISIPKLEDFRNDGFKSQE